MIALSQEYRRPVRSAVIQHTFALLLTSLVLDGGGLFRQCLIAVIAHWIAIVLVFCRRPCSPTQFDLALIHFGFLPMVAVARVVAASLGRAV